LKPYSERNRREQGSSLVEFGIVAVLLVMVLFGVVEICRMLLVYNDVAHAARAGVRYAIVHGSDNPASTTDIQTLVKNFLSSAPMDTASAGLTIDVTYPDTDSVGNPNCKNPGCRVQVTVAYPYDPFLSYFPMTGTSLHSTSKGVITF
jgi:Flp pilus assembly protein TadG